MDLFYKICESLPDYSEGNIWSSGDEILCKTESATELLQN